MKIQYLAIIFVIIMLPVSIVVSSYIQAQIDTISLQTEYDNKLITATYDAIRSFQLNTINNKYSTVSDSKIRDIEASISTFYNSLGTELGSSGYDAETLREFIPAIVYTMYDGYYIYGEYYNDIIGDYQYGLKPYIYYSCRYKKGNNDFVVNYTLDNVITIYGFVNGTYVTKTGTLINLERVTNIRIEQNGNAISLTYKADSTDSGVTIEREILTEQLITLDDSSNAVRGEYEYTIYNNRKIYKDSTGYFWYNNNKKQYIQDEDTLKYTALMTENGHLYCNSAAQYYKNAYDFSKWVNDNLKDITQADAVDSDGNPIKDFAINTGTEKIFKLDSDNDPEKQGSTFQENRISVIRKAIVSNLSTAIANFNTSSNTYEFVMPVFEEEDWEKITNNISVATFMQGIPIGSKYYNNYCIITNDKNKEFIAQDSIYVIAEDGQVHLPTCKKLLTDNIKVVQAYNNVDFERQSVAATNIGVVVNGRKNYVDEVYYYPHANERCYYCMVNSLQAYYDLNDIIDGEINQYNNDKDEYEKDTTATNRLNTTNLRKDYITALARKKYELYRDIEAENRKYTYRVKPIILSVNPTPISATIRAIGEVNNIVGYTVTESDIEPTNFTKCKSVQNLTVTVTGLTPNKTYYAWVIDDEGNISDSAKFDTKPIGNIIFDVIPNTWTNQDVIVTATLTEGDLALQTSKNAEPWQDTANQKFEQNGVMHARVKDYPIVNASIEITNIDKIPPTVTQVDSTTDSATITAIDEGGSGIDGYVITTTNTEPAGGFQKSNVFNNLQQNTTYYVWVKDVAGNISKVFEFKTKLATREVTYCIDTNNTKKENVKIGESCLNPTTFTPTKSGWTFVGWKEDKTADSNVLDKKIMGETPITLYAVFKQTVTVTYYNNSTTPGYVSKDKYYNNGNVSNPKFTIAQANKEGWIARGWSTSTAGDASVNYPSINNIEISSNTTVYALYQREITLSYNGNGASSGSVSPQTGNAYYNSSGNTVNATFVIKENGFIKTDYMFAKWRLNDNTGTAYMPNDTITLTENSTMYAEWMAKKLIVFAKSDVSAIPSIYNRDYVTFNNFDDGSCCPARWWSVGETNEEVSTIRIEVPEPYTKATIVLKCYSNNLIAESNK